MRLLLKAVSAQSHKARAQLTVCDVGTVRQVGDGVASVWGLPQAASDELVRFRHGTLGLVTNLDRNYIDCMLLGSDENIQGGDVVWSTGQRVTVPVGDRLLGRVLDPLGQPIDGRGPVRAEQHRPVEREAAGVVQRQAISQPLQTGIKAVDAIIPIGRGQRELIVGDRQTGKTSLALDTIINQRETGVVCVYVSIGKRKASALQAISTLRQSGALAHTVVVLAAPDSPPALLYLAPYAGCAIAEDFMLEGRDVLIIYDDLTAHADAYRELSLLLRRPPGREAYPGDIFYLHSRLLERACRLSDELGGGSLTALPIVETRRGNIQGYIPTNLISITDGQIYLSPELFNQGFRPAIDIGLSVSRVGGAAQSSVMRKISGQLKLSLAQYDEVAHFARFGTEIDRATQQQITRGVRLREALKQPVHEPLPLARQVVILYAASQGFLDELPTDALARYEEALWQRVQRDHRAIIGHVDAGSDWDESFARRLGDAVEQFSAGFAAER
ncbi:MAG: F0F1 ATP synthase subunit alpha [Chloroflexi bacterium]|nr:F0F1 ATP synthase subunit alpha [Chloroflexota bacterium]